MPSRRREPAGSGIEPGLATRRSLRGAWRVDALRLPMVGLLGVASLPSFAQDGGAAASANRAASVVPTFSVLETYTDNRLLTRTDRQSDLITQLSPGVHLASTSGRVRGQLDYSLNANLYARDASQRNVQNQLNGQMKAELVENRLFVDVGAQIAQQSISAFGTQSPDPSLPNANQSEVGTYSVSPYLRGALGGVATYEARGSYQVLHSDAFSAANSRTNSASFDLRSQRSFASRVGWRLALTHQGTAYSQSRSTASDRGVATLTFAPTPDLQLLADGGVESANLTTRDKQGSRNWGLGLDWRPSERTRVSLSRDKRYFGDSHVASLEYRTPRTVWRYADTQDVTTPASTGTGSTQTAYDLLFAQYASQFPDPLQRAQIVSALLANAGVPRGALVGGGFLSASASLQRRQEFSVALSGLRTTTILSAYQTRTSSLDPAGANVGTNVGTNLGTNLGTNVGDLATTRALRQRGLGATVSHRLTPESSVNVNYSLLRSTADDAALATLLRSLTLTWTTRLGTHVNFSLSARRASFSGAAAPYDESALIAGLAYRF